MGALLSAAELGHYEIDDSLSAEWQDETTVVVTIEPDRTQFVLKALQARTG